MLRTNTVEYAFDTRVSDLTTVIALAGTNFHTFGAIPVDIAENVSRTIRSAQLVFYFRDAEPTATGRRWDGVRMGIQVDAVAWEDQDLSGTGIASTADHYNVTVNRDITSYLQTNYTGTSHNINARIEVRTDVASAVDAVICKLIITYEYDDSSATLTKTVRVPLEGNTDTLSTTANTNLRGTAGAPQIPAFDTFLPESSKVYKNIFFEVMATDMGSTTDFNSFYAIDGGASSTRPNCKQSQNTSVWYYDIWVQNSLATNSTHDFQAWDNQATKMQRLSVIAVVTYTYAASSTQAIVSLVLPFAELGKGLKNMEGTTSADQQTFRTELWIEEPNTIAIKQSGVLLFWHVASQGLPTFSVSGSGAASGTQGITSSQYQVQDNTIPNNLTALHRIDLAHGGTGITLGRGKNILDLNAFVSANASLNTLNGYYILNYTVSDIGTLKHGQLNHTTFWSVFNMQERNAIAGENYAEILTINQKTINIPEANFFINNMSSWLIWNSSAAPAVIEVKAEVLAGEGLSDGWQPLGLSGVFKDGEYGTNWNFYKHPDIWNRWGTDPDTKRLNIESARKYRLVNGTSQMALYNIITYHAINKSISGNITGSGGGLVTIKAYTIDGTLIGTTTRTGDGSYSIPWYDDTVQTFVEAREDASHVGRSDNSIAV